MCGNAILKNDWTDLNKLFSCVWCDAWFEFLKKRK